MNFRWNHLHEGKRVRHVFTDFDDTIAHDASSDMGPEGFNRLVGPSTTKQHFAFNVLKNAASRLDKNKRSKVGIVTARHKSVIPHLRKWLHDREVPNADKVKIHAVGHLTNPLSADEIARRKVKAIGSHVRKGEIRKGDEVHFFDDAKPNVDAVASMRHKGVRFRSVGVGPGRKTKLKEDTMNYGKARELVESAIEQLDEAAKKKPTKAQSSYARNHAILRNLIAQHEKLGAATELYWSKGTKPSDRTAKNLISPPKSAHKALRDHEAKIGIHVAKMERLGQKPWG